MSEKRPIKKKTPEEPLSKSQLKRRRHQQQELEADEEIREYEKRNGGHRDTGKQDGE